MTDKDATDRKPSDDPLEFFVKPWVRLAENFWGDVLSATLTAPQNEEFAAARQAELIATRRGLREMADKALVLSDLPSRADIDALVEDIADIRRQLDRIEERLAQPARPGGRR